MYDVRDLTFVANMGVLQQPVDKTNWRARHDKTSLFAHTTQTEETAQVDVYKTFAGSGVGGRLLNVLAGDGYGYKTGAISVSGSAQPIVSKATSLIVVDPNGYELFNPTLDVPGTTDIAGAVKSKQYHKCR